MNSNLLKTIRELLRILMSQTSMKKVETSLFQISNKEIITSVGNLFEISSHRSTFGDQAIDFRYFLKLLIRLNSSESIIRINHVGFCYKIESQNKERNRLISLVSKSKYHLYEEPSNDKGLWLFVGDAKKWESPMLEFIPVEKSYDESDDYWLPHFQIDIDTMLSTEQIKKIIGSVYGNTIISYPLIINGVVYLYKIRLGVIDGINIFFDIATNERKVEYFRKNILPSYKLI